jgi:two-component system response regulator GlrR
MAAQSDRILVVDDDEQLSEILSLSLESEGYRVSTCTTLARAAEAVSSAAQGSESFSLILLDIRLADGNGIEFLPRLREQCPNLPIFIITAHGDVDSAVEAFTFGANGYIKKPFRDGELKAQIAQAIEGYKLKREVQSLKNAPPGTEIRELLHSKDPAMELVLKRISTAAQVTSTVVITGESGTGKELVARALHKAGTRRHGPFIAFNCAALPENLLESELFGYHRGAFTDAKDNKPGLFARAHGGTLFLDEIGDAPLSIQSKLLRVLQEREVLPLGATSPIKVDVRVIAATHKSLKDEVEQGRFRQDLYYRLHVLPIHVPALRERPKDIVFLGTLFATRIAEHMGVSFEGFTLKAAETLQEYLWPGNVRELQNRVEHAGGSRRSPCSPSSTSASRARASRLTSRSRPPRRPKPRRRRRRPRTRCSRSARRRSISSATTSSESCGWRRATSPRPRGSPRNQEPKCTVSFENMVWTRGLSRAMGEIGVESSPPAGLVT